MNFHFPFGAFTYLLAARGAVVAMSNADANLILRNFHKLPGQLPWATAHTSLHKAFIKETVLRTTSFHSHASEEESAVVRFWVNRFCSCQPDSAVVFRNLASPKSDEKGK